MLFILQVLWKLTLPLLTDSEILLRSESPSGLRAKLNTVQASNRDHAPWSLYYCLFAPHIYCCSLRTSRITQSTQRQRRGCNNAPPLYNEPHRSHILFVKVSHSTTFTSWCQHHFVAIGKARAACAQSFAPWQQATIEIMHRNLSYYCLLAPRIYIFVLRTHPVRGESHNQRNATGEVETISCTGVDIKI